MKRIFTLIFTALLTIAANAWIIEPTTKLHVDSIHLDGVKMNDYSVMGTSSHLEWGPMFSLGDCTKTTTNGIFEMRIIQPEFVGIAVKKPVPVTEKTSVSGIFMSPWFSRDKLIVRLNSDKYGSINNCIYSLKIYYYVYGNCDNSEPALECEPGLLGGTVSEEIHTIGDADLHILTIKPAVPLTNISLFAPAAIPGSQPLPATHPIVKEFPSRDFRSSPAIFITDITMTKTKAVASGENLEEYIAKREMSLSQQIAGLHNENEILANKYKSLNSADVNNDGTTNAADVASVYNYISEGSGTVIYKGYEAVDLALPSGVKWATCNLGAQTPESTGDYYAYGDMVGNSYYQAKATFTVDNYIPRPETSLSTINSIDPSIASELMGDRWWNVPSKKDWEELLDPVNTTQEYVTVNGVAGVRVTSIWNHKSIFFPAAGEVKENGLQNKGKHASYWTSTSIADDTSNPSGSAYYMNFSTGKTFNTPAKSTKYFGLSIRPVVYPH